MKGTARRTAVPWGPSTRALLVRPLLFARRRRAERDVIALFAALIRLAGCARLAPRGIVGVAGLGFGCFGPVGHGCLQGMGANRFARAAGCLENSDHSTDRVA